MNNIIYTLVKEIQDGGATLPSKPSVLYKIFSLGITLHATLELCSAKISIECLLTI